MKFRPARTLLAAATCTAAVLTGCGGGGGNDQPSSLNCTDISTTSLGLSGLKVAQAVDVAASGALPAHCKVTGSVNDRTGIDGKPYAIGFELRLPQPADWKHKFFFQGGGGTDGVIAPATGNLINTTSTTALAQGYAVVATDSGHATGQSDVGFGLDPQARIDYGYNAVGTLTPLAKAIIEKRYASKPTRSYFMGCSNGGRQAMVAASRFGDQFDGLIAGDPGFNLPKAALAEAWDTQQFMSAGAGQLPKDAFPQAAMTLVSQSILAKCDSLDGATDGIVNDRVACQAAFNLATDVPSCSGSTTSGCLSTAQKTAFQTIFDGAKNSGGQSLYASWPWDPGIAGANWRFWKIDAGFAPVPFNTIIGAGALGFIFTTPPDMPNLADGGLGYQLGFSFETDAPKIFAAAAPFNESAMSFMTPPNPTQLTTLKQHGAKLIVYHGTADPVFSANDSIAWYDALSSADSTAASYARLFLVPGMTHCSGGPATDRFNMLTALEDWVEKGTAPDSVVAGINPTDPDVVAAAWPATRTRPLCAYPKQAKLKTGATDMESAASFQCQ